MKFELTERTARKASVYKRRLELMGMTLDREFYLVRFKPRERGTKLVGDIIGTSSPRFVRVSEYGVRNDKVPLYKKEES